MKGISELIDSDMETSTQYLDENSILSSPSEAASPEQPKKKGVKSQASKSRITKPTAASRKPKGMLETAAKNGTKKTAAAKRKALEEHINAQLEQAGQSNTSTVAGAVVESEDELESPKTVGEQKMETIAKAKGNRGKKGAGKKKTTDDVEEIDQTPTVARQSHAQSGVRKGGPKAAGKSKAASRTVQVNGASQTMNQGAQSEPMDTETEDYEMKAPVARPQVKSRARTESRPRQDQEVRRRAGSASDTERAGGDPNLRRKLGDVTRKFENVDLKYRNLKEVGISEATANMEKLRKQCEVTTAASNELIASLKKELAIQTPLAQESRKLHKLLEEKEADASQLRTNVADLSTSLSTAQNEIKVLQAKLAASRSASTAVEGANSKAPGSAMKPNGPGRTIMAGSAEAANAAQAAQLKEELYSDLTGLIVRSVKRTDDGDTYDCIQTGRNGTLHFKLAVAQEIEGKAMSFEETEFLYTPLLDANRDRSMMELLPDYLTEDITFARQHAARFYSRVVDTLTKKKVEE